MDVLAACLQALYRKWQINKGLRRAGSQQRKSAFRYNAYRPCAPRMAHLSIHGCTCCVPASVVSKVADKQRTVESQELSARSEEHTSELQSRPHLVCRLLLEKKKK